MTKVNPNNGNEKKNLTFIFHWSQNTKIFQ